jgi:hypothetical protein
VLTPQIAGKSGTAEVNGQAVNGIRRRNTSLKTEECGSEPDERRAWLESMGFVWQARARESADTARDAHDAPGTGTRDPRKRGRSRVEGSSLFLRAEGGGEQARQPHALLGDAAKKN